jgi:ABC-type siderophore export system fused ATPase/permease subunit
MLLGFNIKGLVLISLFVVINQIVLNQVNSLCYCIPIKFSGVVLLYLSTVNATKIILTLVAKTIF